jgi:hypothetical protein
VVDVGAVLADRMEQHIIRPLDLAYYLNEEKEITFFDCAIVDKVIPLIRAASSVILFFFINNTKGGSDVPWEQGFTYKQIMAGTGIKSRGTMFESLAELGEGRAETKTRPAIYGWNLIIHCNKDKKSKFRRGNRWKLNTEAVIEGVKHKLFNAGINAPYFMMHPWLINELFPTLTPNQVVIFMFIYRMTIGFRREWNSITYNYFTGARREIEGEPAATPKRQSGLTSYSGVKAVIEQLVERGLILVEDGDDPRNGRIYSLNKDLFVTVDMRDQVNHMRDQVNQDARPCESGARPVESGARPVTPPNHDLKHTVLNKSSLTEKDETPFLNPPAKTDSFSLYESFPPLQQTTEGLDKLPLSEQAKPTGQDTNGLEKLTREKRQDILTKNFGLRSTTAINKALDYLDQGMMTDGNIQLALQHKADYPLCGPGIYADYFTMKVKNGVVCGLRPMSEAEMNGSDAAPNSPPTNGHGAAPPLSPTPPYVNSYTSPPPAYYTNGHGSTPAPTVAAEYLEVWKEVKERLHLATTAATFNSVYQKAMLKNVYIRMDVNQETIVFVIGASSSSMDWMKNRAYTSMLRTLTSITGNKQMDFEFISDEKEKV